MNLRTTLAIGAATVATVSALAVVSVRKGIDRDWDAMLVQLDELETERLAAPAVRGVLYGEATSDAAWPYYQRALEELRGIDEFAERARVAPYATTDEERAARDVLLDEAEALFTNLRRGAHARDVTSPLDWSAGMSMRIQRLMEVRPLCELAVARFVASLEDGDDVRGVEALLDVQQFARDLCVSPILIEEMIGVSVLVPSTTEDVLATESARALSREAKEHWLDGLDALDASLPTHSAALLGEVELLGREFVRAFSATDQRNWTGDLEVSPGWRYRFSWRRAATDYVDRATDLAREIEADYDATPVEVLRKLNERQSAFEDDPNPLFDMAMPKIASAAKSRYWNLARLSYLRHALALDLGRTPDEPLDPFGNGVQVEVSDDRIRVWTEVEDRNPNALEIVLMR